MECPFCGWGMGLAGTIDPCEVVLAFEDHLTDHMIEMTAEITERSPDG